SSDRFVLTADRHLALEPGHLGGRRGKRLHQRAGGFLDDETGAAASGEFLQGPDALERAAFQNGHPVTHRFDFRQYVRADQDGLATTLELEQKPAKLMPCDRVETRSGL